MKLKNERIIHLNWWIAGLGVPPTRADRRKHGLLRWMFPNGLRRRGHHPHTQRDMASGCLYQCHLPDQKRRRTKNKHETIQTNSIQTSPHWRFFFFFTVGGRNGASTMWRTPRHGRLRLQLLLKRCWLLSRLWKNPMSLLERHSRGDSFVPKYSFHMADARLNVKRSHASIITTISSVSVVITLLSVNPIYCLFSVGVTFDWHTKRSPEAAGDRRRILVLLSSVPMKLINQSPSRRTSSRVLRLSAKNWYEYQQWLSHCLLSRPAPAGSGARLIRSTLLL